MFSLNNVKYKNILDISNLKINKNEITCIIGESGSGKSTLLRLLNKLITCDSGEILYRNKLIDDINSIDLRRKVVMLSQNPVIYPGTIKDNLLIGLEFAGKAGVSDEELKSILKIVHLKKELSNNGETLSGGEKQRLALGRVILLNPDVFLLDEPSSALDEETEESMIKQIVEYIKKANKTLIMVIHSKKIAQNYSDNIIEINKGKVIKFKED